MADDSVLIKLQQSPLEAGAAFSFLQDEHAGAIAIFVGTTRQWTDEIETTRLEYEAYEPMAVKEMKRLAAEAKERWPVLRLVLIHRLGGVPIKEASVLVGVAAPHRKTAFEACRFLIDTLKERVPIWKNEHYADGATEWIGG